MNFWHWKIQTVKLFLRKFMRKLFGIILMAILVIVIIFSSFYFYLKAKLPPTEGTVKISGLTESVTIKRDHFGIPHIFAKNERDLFKALGFTIAGDRLFQMDMQRRLAHGELSEVLGPNTVELDKFFRTLRFKETLRANWERHQKELDPHMVQLIHDYLDGVNSYLQEGHLPVEFSLLNYTPKPFTLDDIFGFMGHMSFNFAWTFETNLLFNDLAKKLPSVKINEMRQHLRGMAPQGKLPRLSDFKLLPHQYQDFNGEQKIYETLKAMIGSFGPIKGSNSWVLSGNRSASGYPILASDPHISFSNPNIWYEAHLHSPTFEIYGHFMPLVPFPTLGHNRQMGWAVTMSQVDEMAFFREEFSPHNPKLIAEDGQWKAIHYYETVIKVKDEEDVLLPIRITPRGPLLNEIMSDNKAPPISLYWTFYHPNNVPLKAIYHIMRASNLNEFARHLSWIKSPGMNISYVDRSGNIAWWVVGQIPIRPPNYYGDMIMDSTKGDHKKLRVVPFDQNPRLINPPSGVIVSANFIPPVKVPYRIEGDWSPSERFERITYLLSKKQKWSLEELKKVQTDSVDILSTTLLPKILAEVKVHKLKSSPYLVNLPPHLIEESLSFLRLWKGEAEVNSIGMTLFAQWIENIIRALLEPSIGDSYKSYCELPDALYFLKNIFHNPNSEWRKKGQLSNAVNVGLSMTLYDLSKMFGTDIKDWRWGKAHTVEYRHTIGQQWPLNYIFNVGPYEAPGGHHQVNCMDHSMCHGFKVESGPTTRRLVDMADPEHSLGILPIGNSGNLTDPHHHDQVKLFLSGEYRPQLLNINEIEENKTKELILAPK